jgi:hypothetical protein
MVGYARMVQRPSGKWPPVDPGRFAELQHDALALVEMMGAGRPPLGSAAADLRALKPTMADADRMLGVLRSVENSYERGFLEPLFVQLERALAGDYLAQAEELLDEGHRGKCDHVPAAVLLGAVFEKRIRTLCADQSPPIEVRTPDDHPKKLIVLIEDLKRALVFNETTAKELRWIAGVRNNAAHGEFGEFDRDDVERMQTSVRQFLEDHTS